MAILIGNMKLAVYRWVWIYLWMVIVSGDSFAINSEAPLCKMHALVNEFKFPRQGFIWLNGDDAGGQCSKIVNTDWSRKKSGSQTLFVHLDGPSGSGHYWTVSYGAGDDSSSAPSRGGCLQTSTAGWRTLQKFGLKPLAWLDDTNKDGNAGIVIWHSFPLVEEPSAGEYGLMAWVYRQGKNGTYTIDWNMTRDKADELAKAYREPLELQGLNNNSLRENAALALEQFAHGICGVGK